MQKVLAVLLLVSHINFSMFIAQVDEVDVYDKNGRQLNDINSLAEFINYTLNGTKSKPTQDEDDDNARYFHLAKFENYCFTQQVIEVKRLYALSKEKIKYPPYIQQKLNTVFSDIQSPPPKA